MVTSAASQFFFPNFTWAITRAFADPLSTCRFEQGDTLYDNEAAYQQPWSKTIKTAGRAIQVLSPSRGVSSKSPGQDDSAFADNWQQEVIFDLHQLKTGSSETITTTQGRLYTLLWRGDTKILDEATDAPSVPQQASALKKLLPEAVKLFQTELMPDPNLIRFLLPCDLAAGLYYDKYLNVKKKLDSEFSTTVQLEPAGSLGGQQGFLPTVHVAAFTLQGATAEQVESALQDVLYKPSAGRKGVARFRLKTHGLLL
jgi:hypothetical protein